MSNSYSNKEITIQFTLGSGETFDQNGSNTLIIKKARCHATFQYFTGLSGSELSISIWGLSKEYLSILGCMGMVAISEKQHRIKLSTGDISFFEGVIATSYADFNNIPDVPLVITASPSIRLAIESFPGFEGEGVTKVSDIIASISSTVGLAFENYGVDAVIEDPKFNGDALSCIFQAAEAVDVVFEISLTQVTIWPRGAKRDDIVLNVSKGNGLLGYPAWCPVGLLISTVYTHLAVPGRQVELTTDLPNASGRYTIIGVENTVSSELNHGQWQTTMYINNEQT